MCDSAINRLVLVERRETAFVDHQHDDAVGQQCERRDGGENHELVFRRIDRIAAGDDLTSHHARNRDNAGRSKGRGSGQ